MSRSWYVEHNGKPVGPATSSQLKKLAQAGKINRKTRVKLGDDGDWVRAAKVQGLFASTEIARPKQELVTTQPPVPVPAVAPPQTIVVTEPTPVTQKRPCPFCGEDIAMSAIKCRHCNEFLDGRPRESAVPQPVAAPQPVVNVTQVTNVGGVVHKQWSPLVAAILSFVIPGLGQLYKGQIINGAVWFVVVIIGYVAFIVPGLVLHLCCIIGAATGNPHR